jgi:hypothetical protein
MYDQYVGVTASGSVSANSDPNTVLATGTQTIISDNTLTTVATFTAIATTRATTVYASGTDYARYTIVLNAVTILTLRSGPSRNVGAFINIELGIGDVLDIKVEHFDTSVSMDSEATILGFT